MNQKSNSPLYYKRIFHLIRAIKEERKFLFCFFRFCRDFEELFFKLYEHKRMKIVLFILEKHIFCYKSD